MACRNLVQAWYLIVSINLHQKLIVSFILCVCVALVDLLACVYFLSCISDFGNNFLQNRQNCSQLPGSSRVSSARALPSRVTGKGRGRGDFRLSAKEAKAESTRIKERELSTPEVFQAFSTRFIRLNGILFTRTRYFY